MIIEVTQLHINNTNAINPLIAALKQQVVEKEQHVYGCAYDLFDYRSVFIDHWKDITQLFIEDELWIWLYNVETGNEVKPIYVELEPSNARIKVHHLS